MNLVRLDLSAKTQQQIVVGDPQNPRESREISEVGAKDRELRHKACASKSQSNPI